MKKIKADYFFRYGLGYHLEYTIGKKRHSVDGEFHYNQKKDRMEHIHLGPKGGQYLVIFNY